MPDIDHCWVCKGCGSLVPNADMACICGWDGRTPDGRPPQHTKPSSAGWRERALREERERHPEWEKGDESSRDYSLRHLQIQKRLARELEAKWKAFQKSGEIQ